MASILSETRSFCLSAEEEADFVKSVITLGGKTQALQFIEQVFKCGYTRVHQLLETANPVQNYDHDSERLHPSRAGSTRTTPQVEVGVNDTVNTAGIGGSVAEKSYYKCTAEVAPWVINPCNGYRREPYKTPRGLREHLTHKHGWTENEAESEARSVFGAGIQLAAVQQPTQQNTCTTCNPQNLYGREEELESSTKGSDFDDPTHWNDRFDGWSSSG